MFHAFLAHEKWFIDTHQFPLRIDHMLRAKPMGFIIGILVLTAVLGLIWHKRKKQEILPGPLDLGADPERLCGFYGLVPGILAIHIAVPLIMSGIQRSLFTINNPLSGAIGYFLGLGLMGCALSFFYGALTRFAAVMLAIFWLMGFFVASAESMLDNIHILGFAGFFFLAGRGPIAIDRLILPKLEPRPEQMAKAMTVLRIGLGLSLTIVAFTEKFANIPMALSFLQKFPVNFTPKFGMPMSDETFVLCAGAVELLVGLCITFGIYLRTILVIAWVPINMSLSYFNWNAVEIVGHLPIYGAMAVLMVWDPAGSHVPLFVRGLREGPLKIQNNA